MPSENRLILKYADEPGYKPDIESYLRHGGYEALKKALAIQPKDLPEGKKMSGPEQIRDEVMKSGLRGRGGAGFSCGLKWSFVDRRSGKPIYLICNADESEPGTFKDRQILHKDPHQMIEGMIISCYANDVKLAYIYIRGEFPEGARILNRALKRGAREKFPRQKHSRQRLRSGDSRPSRRGRLHLRRGNRADRIARRQARLSAHQAALFPGGARPLSVPDDRQQRRDALRREAHRGDGRRRNSRSSARRTTPARASSASAATSRSRAIMKSRSARPPSAS